MSFSANIISKLVFPTGAATHDLVNLVRLYGWTAAAILLSLSSITLHLYRRQRRSTTQFATKYTTAKSSSIDTTKMTPLPGNVRVSKIMIHPIKSCRGISVLKAEYTPEGLENDRTWSIMDATKLKIITARDIPKMVLIRSSIGTDGTLKVEFPDSSECEPFSVPLHPTEEMLHSWTSLPEIELWPTHAPLDGYICEALMGAKGTASASLSKFFGKPVHLLYKGRKPRRIDPTVTFPELDATAKYQDMYPLLVLSEESTVAVDAELRKHVGSQGIDEKWSVDNVAIERFRPNIIFQGGGPFAEDNWEEISIGSEESPSITLVSRCTRCLLPNVSPETGERDNAVPFKVLMKFRTGIDPTHKLKPCVGCNGVPSRSGSVNVGDRVYVKKMIVDNMKA